MAPSTFSPAALLPRPLQFNNSVVNYTISGTSGPIEGPATLSKSGTGLLSIQNLNTYTPAARHSRRHTPDRHEHRERRRHHHVRAPRHGHAVAFRRHVRQRQREPVTLANSVAITANSTLSSSGGGTLVFDGTSADDSRDRCPVEQPDADGQQHHDHQRRHQRQRPKPDVGRQRHVDSGRSQYVSRNHHH